MEPADRQVVSFVGAGDNIVYYGNVRDAASLAIKGRRTYNFKPTYTDVAQTIADADVAFINQETLMCGDGYAFSYYPRFNGPQDLGYDLQELGFDVVNCANNHMLDKGAGGLAATINFWRTLEGVTLIGGYLTEDEFHTVTVVERNGIRIAFLSYTEMTNTLTLPDTSKMVVPYFDKAVMKEQIAAAREAADCVIVSIHWGEENTFKPNELQKEYAQFLTQNGVDVIIGTHPHVLQPIEWITDASSGHRTLCVYSLGNFVAEMSADYNMLGGLIGFSIVKSGETVTIEDVVFRPTVYYFTTTFYQNHVYFLEDFTDALADSHGLRYYGKILKLSKLKQYLTVIDRQFLPETLR